MASTETTQQLVQISEIRDGVLVLKNGSLRGLVEVSAMNFELRAEDEQTAIIQNFQNFLNSLDFPLQIVVNSRRLKIDKYIDQINTAVTTLDNELLKIQATEYSKFIREISTLANIMSKKFYVVVPLYIFDTQNTKGIFSGLISMFSTAKPQKMDDVKFATYRNQLQQRVELVLDGLVGMGLKPRLMESEEIEAIFYNLYNPAVDDSARPISPEPASSQGSGQVDPNTTTK